MATSAVSATSSTETQYPVLINGYLCYSAAEVRAARQMINPSSIDKLTGLPARESETTSQTSSTQTTTQAATVAASQDSATTTRTSFLDSLRTYTAQGTNTDEEDRRYARGTLVNILA